MEVEAIAGACRRSLGETLRAVSKLTTNSQSVSDSLLNGMNEVLREVVDTNFTTNGASMARLLRVLEQSHAALIGECDSLPLLFFARSFAVVIDEAVRLLRQQHVRHIEMENMRPFEQQHHENEKEEEEEGVDDEEWEVDGGEEGAEERLTTPSDPDAAATAGTTAMVASDTVAVGGGEAAAATSGLNLREQLLQQLEAAQVVNNTPCQAPAPGRERTPPVLQLQPPASEAGTWSGASTPREDQLISPAASVDTNRERYKWSDSSYEDDATAAAAAAAPRSESLMQGGDHLAASRSFLQQLQPMMQPRVGQQQPPVQHIHAVAAAAAPAKSEYLFVPAQQKQRQPVTAAEIQQRLQAHVDEANRAKELQKQHLQQAAMAQETPVWGEGGVQQQLLQPLSISMTSAEAAQERPLPAPLSPYQDYSAEAIKGRITIYSIPSGVREEDVEEFLAPAGKHLSLHLLDDMQPRCAFVKFETNEQADAAVDLLHGALLGGVPVAVRRAAYVATYPGGPNWEDAAASAEEPW